MNRFAKFVAVVLVLGVIVSVVPAKAATTAELEAQIAQLQALIASLTGQLGGGSSAGSSASYTYTVDLTLGSKGADVTALQQFLVSKGFLTMPAGASYGTFGPLTKAALASFQASAGISPAAGYFGPKTRAYMNSMVVVTSSPVPSGTIVPSTPPSGMEGIITVEKNATPASGVKIYEGDQGVALLGLKIKAQNSEISVKRVKVGLGVNATVYTRTLSNLGIYDGSTLLQNKALNSSSVVRESGTYYVYFTDLNLRVDKDTTKVLTLKGDIFSTVGSYVSIPLTVPTDGVRGVDGAGLEQKGPSSAGITQTLTVSTNLADTAQLTVSKNGTSPVAQNLVSDTQGVITEKTVLVLDFKAKNDLVKIDQMALVFTGSANETSAFLYDDGGALLQSASVVGNTATFTDMEDSFQVAKDTTKKIVVKVSYDGATTTAATSTVSTTATDFLAYNNEGVSVTGGRLSVSGASENMSIISAGPVISFTSGVTAYQAGVQGVSSSSAKGTFVLDVKAEGENLYFWNESATSSSGSNLRIYNAATNVGLATSTTVQFSSAFQNMTGGAYRLSDGQSGTITIVGTVLSSAITGTNINFRLPSLKWALVSNSDSAVTTSLDVDVYRTTPFVVLP